MQLWSSQILADLYRDGGTSGCLLAASHHFIQSGCSSGFVLMRLELPCSSVSLTFTVRNGNPVEFILQAECVDTLRPRPLDDTTEASCTSRLSNKLDPPSVK